MAGSFDRDIRCRGDRRKVHRQTRLPLLWKCELVNRDIDNELMEANREATVWKGTTTEQ